MSELTPKEIELQIKESEYYLRLGAKLMEVVIDDERAGIAFLNNKMNRNLTLLKRLKGQEDELGKLRGKVEDAETEFVGMYSAAHDVEPHEARRRMYELREERESIATVEDKVREHEKQMAVRGMELYLKGVALGIDPDKLALILSDPRRYGDLLTFQYYDALKQKYNVDVK